MSQAPGGFSLFPNTATPRPPSRNQTPRPRATTPQSASPAERTPPRAGRKRSIRSPEGGAPPETEPSHGTPLERPPPVALSDVPPRCETAFSEAQTLVRSSSNRSRSSIAKPPLAGVSSAVPSAGPSRSIFPQYNHDLPLDRQEYFPTQASPTHIPRSAISRPLYSPADHASPRTPGPAIRSPMSAASPPLSSGTTGRWPPRPVEPPVVPATSTADELRGLWKVANGWRAAGSEGAVFCLKMTADKDAPVYTLSSDSQPFYRLRLDPTSASAYVTLSRHDPQKRPDKKHWQEALATTLEPESRRLPPGDGLEALLVPAAAARLAAERPNNGETMALAEKESGRLVWDADSGSYFLVHGALAVPFCVTVERSPAWSRTEYTLEHLESPRHLGRLTRDGTGAGWLEIDTGLAAQIDAAYLADVAVAALLLVAHKDERFSRADVFEPPPVLGSPDGSLASGSRRGGKRGSSRLSWTSGKEGKSTGKKASNSGRRRMEEFEVDVESQDSELGKRADTQDKVPAVVRGLVKVVTALLKCVVWLLTMGFRAVAAVVSGLARCLK